MSDNAPLSARAPFSASVKAVLPGLTVLFALLLSFLFALVVATPGRAAGALTIDIGASYNLIVDSNVLSPSTYAPSVATVTGRFCNTGDETLTGVVGYIGNYNGASSTPGVYPTRDSANGAFIAQHPHLANTGLYAFTHVGGRQGLTDAERFIGDIAPGECRVQYWHFTYPRRANPDNTGAAIWGDTRSDSDDLWLEFDIWGSSADAASANATWRMTMRNTISAMANKIKPNPDGHWFNTDTSRIAPGTVITSNGVLYTLGNINQGFDNDGDFAFDYNAWLQPIGDPAYDPSCFRLIRTSGVVTVTRSGGAPPIVMPFQDQMYFTNLPEDNTGLDGNVYYTFVALDGPCATALSPYQSAASGANNEKFNGDYGTGTPPLLSSEATFSMSKDGPERVATGSIVTYEIPFANTEAPGGRSIGLPLYSMPLVLSDTIPSGMIYVAGSAASVVPGDATVRYFDSSTGEWTTTEPPAANVSAIQWWLNEPLEAATAGSVSFQSSVPLTYSGAPVVENTACAQMGNGSCFDEASSSTLIQGTSSIGDFVWQDTSGDGVQNGVEPVLQGVVMELYWDRAGNGLVDEGDTLLATTTSNPSGSYSFTQLPAARYIVQPAADNPTLPAGYRVTTVPRVAVNLPGGTAYTQADFGFGPSLRVDKSLVNAGVVYEDDMVSFTIDLTNTRPGDGSGEPAMCTYTFWANTATTGSGGSAWLNPTYAAGQTSSGAAPELNGAHASATFDGGMKSISATGFAAFAPPGATITKVEALFRGYVANPVNNQEFACGAIGSTSTNCTGANQTLFPTSTLDTMVGAANTKTLVWDVTAQRSWSWTAFTGPSAQVLGFGIRKNGAGSSTTMHLDALGYRVTTDQTCGTPEDTLGLAPLTDTFDATRLEFVDADPVPASIDFDHSGPVPTGVVHWNNLGPLYAGGTRQVVVNFRALEPAGSTPVTTINTGTSTGATFVDGELAGESTDSAPVTITPSGRIGDRVWLDMDGAGDQDAEEPGLPGVTLELRHAGCTAGSTCPRTITDNTGAYSFSALGDTTYSVAVVTGLWPGGMTGVTQTHDRDGTATAHTSSGIVLNNQDGSTANDDYSDVDFGYRFTTARIMGSVWHDWRGTGLPFAAPGEEGFSGVVVYADNGACSYPSGPSPICQSAMSNALGQYTMTGIGAGSYSVRVDASTLPGGASLWTPSYDGPVGGTPDGSVPITLPSGGLGRADYSYHHVGTLQLGDTVYRDWNGNGVQDTGEEGLADISVSLFQDDNGNGLIDDSDAWIDTSTTNSSGAYLFENLADGAYTAVIRDQWLPGGHHQSQDPDEAGTCAVCDHHATVLLAGTSALGVDWGYQPLGTATISGEVWKDSSRDGYFQTNEPTLPNVLVFLYEDSDGDGVQGLADALVATASTATDGSYTFTEVPIGAYVVVVDVMDADLPTDGYGNLYVPTTPTSFPAEVLGGETLNPGAFGFGPGAVIGDQIWRDTNFNGLVEQTEDGIEQVVVELYRDADGSGSLEPGDSLVASTTTNAAGGYEFTGLLPGTYIVLLASGVPADYVATYDPDASGVPCIDCNAQASVTLQSGQIDRSVDFGFRTPLAIGDQLWVDTNGDGIRQQAEAAVVGVTIHLMNDGLVLASTTTTKDGRYAFGDIEDGDYTVEIASASVPTGLIITYDPDGELNGSTTVIVQGGVVTSVGDAPCSGCEFDVDWGFQLAGSYSISGTTFFDATNDGGLYAPGVDLPYGGILVYLWKDSEQVGAITTEVDGSYEFSNLPDGMYTVSVSRNHPLLEGLTLQQRTPADPEGMIYRTFALTGASVTQRDFGFYGALDFGDLPESYTITRLSEQGARHIAGDRHLGLSMSTEGDGTPSALSGSDTGDDGITPTNQQDWAPGSTGTLSVMVNGDDAFLSAWVDWSQDGDFDDAGEQILLDEGVSTGVQPVSFPIPSNVTIASTFNARFRLYESSTGGTASPRGVIANGEVEDYQWVLAPSSATLASFTAEAQSDMVALAWETYSEADTLGFNLWRSDNASVREIQLGEMVHAQSPGSATGNGYTYTDDDVDVGATYYYWLEIVATDGSMTQVGPLEATVASPTALQLNALDARSSGSISAALVALMAAVTLGTLMRRGHHRS